MVAYIPKFKVLCENSKKICPLCRHTFKEGQEAITFITGSYNNFINHRSVHSDCFFIENLEFLPSKKQINKYLKQKIIEKL